MKGTKLKRSISLPVLFLYGLGTMVGGGFYALSGKVAGMAGMAAPLAFLLAGLLAFLNVFTFAELSSRYPVSAGEAKYVHEAFRSPWFSGLIGWLVILTGVVSAATLSVATIAFLQDLLTVPEAIGLVVLILSMGLICAWGVGESVKAVVAITFIEVGALFYILFSKGENLSRLPDLFDNLDTNFVDGFPLFGIASGAFLAFYAFVGFEDMVNMAEEVKKVKTSLPKAMIWAVAGTTILYVLVITTMVLTVSPAELAAANAPLAKIIEADGPVARKFFIIISMLTGINGALVQIVMSSRVLYGLGKEKKAPKIFTLYYNTDEVLPTADSSADLEELAGRIIEDIQSRQHKEVMVSGHADRQGSEGYNMNLSENRAITVRDRLIERGVNSDSISVEWFGESQNALDTADGVAESANRRVEIQVR